MANKSKYSDSKRFFNGVYIYGDYTKIPGYSKEALNKTFFFETDFILDIKKIRKIEVNPVTAKD